MADKLKIGLIIDASLDPPDGVQQYVVSLGEWLRSKGHDVHYLAGQTEKRQLPNIHSLARNVGVMFNGNRTTVPLPARRRNLRRFIQQQQFDVLHVQTPHHPFMAQHLITAAGPTTAVIATFHILPYAWLSRLGNRLLASWLRPSLRRIDTMLAVSPAAAEFEKHSFGLPVEVLPNVIDYQLFQEARPLKDYDDDRLTILFLGRLVPRKGAQLLIEAVALLEREKLPPFRVLVCGKGPLQPKLEQLIAERRLQAIVTLTGFVSEADKPRYYASADIAVFPSRGGESFGIVLLEALAARKPMVLGGDNPGYASVMAPRPDLLFDPDDAAALATKLRHFLTDQSERQTAAAWGTAYASNFDTAIVGRKLLAVYRRALRKRRGA